LAGGSFAPGDDTPRSVAKKYYDIVCPDAHILDKDALRATLPPDYSAATVIQAWLKMLKDTPDRCVEIDDNIFDIWYAAFFSPVSLGWFTLDRIFGSERLLDAIPMLFRSPIMSLFRWSPLVTDAFQRNAHLLVSHGYPDTSLSDPFAPINGLLVLHIRRGDFEGHCQHLARWRSDWSGFNKIPGLIEQWNRPPVDDNDEMYPDGKAAYARSCYPTIDQIVEKVEGIRQTNEGKRLRNIFIMTNGKVGWVEDLKLALWRRRNWRRIESSRDMTLSWEQKHVAAAVDTLIGQRADVFVGNGASLPFHPAY
jgi:GDP-fucose protein O-fucosyltransferase